MPKFIQKKPTQYLFAALILLPGATDVHANSLDFALGKALFDRPWTSAPSATHATDGLGPLFNARSCVACHPKAGRGVIKIQNDGHIGSLGFIVKAGTLLGTGDPVYGQQIQTSSVQTIKPEAQFLFQNKTLHLENLAYGPLSPETNIGLRLAQPLYGLGLIEKIPASFFKEREDPNDQDQDGISGRIHWVNGEVGLFGWKASQHSLYSQSANAFLNDIGMSTPVYPNHYGDCTEQQAECLAAPNGAHSEFEDLEISTDMLELVTSYLQGLKPPHKVEDKQAQTLFNKTGCADCHTPKIMLKDGRKIEPYSDFLLHDMGKQLDDQIAQGDAKSYEWRTQPLWGSKNTTQFLHDGRAQTIAEAVSFHNGEAAQSRLNFEKLNAADKQKLIDFISRL